MVGEPVGTQRLLYRYTLLLGVLELLPVQVSDSMTLLGPHDTLGPSSTAIDARDVNIGELVTSGPTPFWKPPPLIEGP